MPVELLAIALFHWEKNMFKSKSSMRFMRGIHLCEWRGESGGWRA